MSLEALLGEDRMSVLRRTLLPLVAVLLLGPAAVAGAATLDSLVASERAFARMSLEQGVRDAFLHWMAPDGVIFRPLATNARQAWELARTGPGEAGVEPRLRRGLGGGRPGRDDRAVGVAARRSEAPARPRPLRLGLAEAGRRRVARERGHRHQPREAGTGRGDGRGHAGPGARRAAAGRHAARPDGARPRLERGRARARLGRRLRPAGGARRALLPRRPGAGRWARPEGAR